MRVVDPKTLKIPEILTPGITYVKLRKSYKNTLDIGVI